MVILGNCDGRPVTVSVKPNCLTVSVEGPIGAAVCSYDCAGRLWTALLDDVSYRRGLDGKLVAKWQAAGGEKERRWLVGNEARQIEEQARGVIAGVWEALESGRGRLDRPLPPEGEVGFRRALAFDTPASQADAARYHQVYRTVGILPPDQYMAVVLQATEGCSFNTCTFCDFYKTRPFRIKRPDEFRAHAAAVAEYLGAGLSLRRTIFLGDANALVIPTPRLLPLVEEVHSVYDVEKLGGMYAFLDGFSGDKKTSADYHALKERGLVRVYIGLESGHEPLLRFLKKPGRPEDALQAVRAMKEGGLSVGVIVLLGAGGQTYAAAHVRDTVRLINRMQLDLDDLIYFSELIEGEGLQYVQDAYQAGLQPLNEQERLTQAVAIESGLKFSRRSGTPHISRYDIREFVY